MRHPRSIDLAAIGDRAQRDRDRPEALPSPAALIAGRLRDILDNYATPRVSMRREDAELLVQWLEEADARRAAYDRETCGRVARLIKSHIPERTGGKKNFMHACCREFGAILVRKLERPR